MKMKVVKKKVFKYVDECLNIDDMIYDYGHLYFVTESNML